MEAAAASSSFSSCSSLNLAESVAVDESYRVLPTLYLAFLGIWCFSALSWTLNTWRNRHFQVSKLQWMLASVPVIKTLQLALSFSFCLCCIIYAHITWLLYLYERLSLPERRKTAALACFLYLTLVGYKAAVPYFTVLLLVNYSLSFYVIFHYISQNLFILREQLNFIEDEDIQTMHDALHTKYTVFKKFQGAMQIAALVEILAWVYMNVDEAPEGYCFRLLVREWAHFCIFLYIGWTFRTKEASPNFSVIPSMKLKCEKKVRPIYSMPTSFPSSHCNSSADQLLVIVQPPHAAGRGTSDALIRSKLSASRTASNNKNFHCDDAHV